MHVRDLGARDSPAVLLVHGGVIDGSIFEALAASLATRFRVLVPDLPGHGRSPLLDPYSVEAVQAALRRALDERAVRAPAAVGYSLGAHHVLALALAGAAFSRIVLLGAIAGLEPAVREGYREYAAAVRGGARLGAALVDLALPPEFAAARPELVRAMAAAADATPPATVIAELEAIAELPDLRPRLGEIRAPVLLRVGALDRTAPPALSEQIAARIPGARLEVIPGVGHLLMQQDPEGTLASVERFLLA